MTRRPNGCSSSPSSCAIFGFVGGSRTCTGSSLRGAMAYGDSMTIASLGTSSEVHNFEVRIALLREPHGFQSVLTNTKNPVDQNVTKPADVLRSPLPPTNLYFLQISRIHALKTGPFHEHSSQLHSIAVGVPFWAKVNTGLIKMYEVRSEAPICLTCPSLITGATFSPLRPKFSANVWSCNTFRWADFSSGTQMSWAPSPNGTRCHPQQQQQQQQRQGRPGCPRRHNRE
jgi:hypothetical protein